MKLKWVHRQLKFSPHNKYPQRGPDVRALQKSINKICRLRGLHTIAVDGECGRQTIARGRQVARSLGLKTHKPGLSVTVQHLVRHPNLRNVWQRRRSRHWVKENGTSRHATVSGNTATGGSLRERIVASAEEAANLYATGKSHRFYSQPGAWTVEHGITGEPSGCRSDCSQFVTSMYHSAGAPDPNGYNYKGGYTGTLENHCKEISRAALTPGDLVLYGSRGATHHVEMYVGPGNRTIGHGSPPVDAGDIYMIAQPRFFRAPGV